MKEISGYDLTCKKSLITQEKLVEFLNEWAKNWVFQEEKGETGYEHWQGRLRLIKPKSEPALKKLWSAAIPGIHISPTADTTFQKGSFQYVMKADTRVAGPWTDSTPIKTMTDQLQQFLEFEMRPWQKDIVQLVGVQDFRKIIVIIDQVGNTGKSILAEYMEYNDLAFEIPPFTVMEDLMQCCMCIPPQKAYLIDMPRGMKKDKLASFYAGIESLKNGVMYDKRYAFKKRRITRPVIIVFTNQKPDTSLLSIDRWDFRQINVDMSLSHFAEGSGATL